VGRAPEPSGAARPVSATPSGEVPPPVVPELTSEQLAALAESGGLKQMGVRPPLGEYVRDLWNHRTFTVVLARSKAYARNQTNYLGQLWAVLNPVLNALMYVLIFGLLLHTSRGVNNGIAFIVVGTFTYRFFNQSINAGARAITSNLSLVRSVHFPRAILPTSSVLSELTTTIPALVVMCLFAFGAGFIPGYGPVPITWRWLLMPVAVLLLWIFNTGCAFMVARWVAITPDLNNVIPFLLQLIMYGSGVIFSIDHALAGHETLATLFQYQPVAVYLDLVRACILSEPTIPLEGSMWVAGVVWAMLFVVVGFFIFWRGEERYGRD
jgi:teichoic acid transport system permease protein